MCFSMFSFQYYTSARDRYRRYYYKRLTYACPIFHRRILSLYRHLSVLYVGVKLSALKISRYQQTGGSWGGSD